MFPLFPANISNYLVNYNLVIDCLHARWSVFVWNRNGALLYSVCPPMNSRMIEVGGIAAISAGFSAVTRSRNESRLCAFS